MYQCPITYFRDHIIFNYDKSPWAVYKIVGFDYDFLDDDAKIKILHKTARFLCGILSEAQVLIVPIEQDNKEHFKALKNRLSKSDPLYENAIYHAEQTEIYLGQKVQVQGNANDYNTYIVVKLSENGEYELFSDLKHAFQYFVKDPVNAINVFMNLDTKDILESRIKQCQDLADKWYFAQNKKLRLCPVDGGETQWLIKRGCFRGIADKNRLFYADQNKAPWKPSAERVKAGNGDCIIKPESREMVKLFAGTIYQGKRYLKIVHDKETVSYQTFLTFTNIPEVTEHPGSEWLYLLQQLNQQAEVCIHIKVKEYREAIRKVENKRMEINSQMEHILEANADIPDDLAEGKEYADLLEGEIKSQRAPILETHITVCVAADNLEDLEKKAVTIREIYEDMSFGVERSVADQLKLFMQCIPSQGSLVRDYMIPLTPMTLAGGIIGATHELGDHKGPYIAVTGSEEKQVFLDLGRACLLNKSASATFYGNLGVGKSFNANLLLFLTVLYGGYGLIFDPKGERSHWVEQLNIFEGMITIVTLSSDASNKGKLDPYNMYEDNPDEADELALNIISELLKIPPASMEYTAVLEAQRMMRKEAVPSMMKLIDMLRSFSQDDELYQCARFLARRLSLQAASGMSKLLFGEGTEKAVSLDKRLNILQIENIKLPSPDASKEEYTSEEVLSTVLMSTAAHFAKKFALVERNVFSVILFDESWMLGKTVEGIKLYDFLSRMGRSLFTGCIFNGHSVLDMPSEGIKNTISYKFCFQTNNDSEAARMCEYMDIEPTQENKDILKNLRNGECLFQDLDKHVGVIRFDAVFQDIIDVFSTTPKERKPDAEERLQAESEVDMPEDIVTFTEAAEEDEERFDDFTFEFDEDDLLAKEEV